MRVLIVGGGKVGSHLAETLAAQNNEISLVEVDEERCALLKDELPKGVALTCGDGDEPLVLEEAGIRAVDAVVAATGHDEDNLVVTLLGKQEYDVPFTIARINNPRNEWLFTKEFGVDTAVLSTTIISDLLDKCFDAGCAE